tara:strand:- start:34 stop:2388 length:2355 start_codon:yes stop_codon:yes gene_type:complete
MITYFKTINDTDKPYHIDIDRAIDRIRNGSSRDLIEQIRLEKEKDSRNELKKQLPAICFSGTFSSRRDSDIIEHSGIMCLDFDGFTSKDSLNSKRLEVIEDPYTYCVFTSPSGDGLKVLVRIPFDAKNHKKYFKALETYYNCEEFDTSCKNISRVCYESYDPDLFVNEMADVWEEMEKEPEYKAPVKSSIRISDSNEIIRRLSLWWDKNYGMVQGQKNNNLFILASALNEFGINQDEAFSTLNSYDSTGEKSSEILAIVRSAYKNISGHNTKFYEDVETTSEIEKKVKMGVPMEQIKADHQDIDVDEVAKSVDFNEFWIKNSKGKIDLVPHLFRLFLQDNGFYKYYPVGSNNFVFVRVVDNTISDVNEEMIKDFVLDFLLEIDDMSVYNFFALNTKFFQETFLNYVSRIEPNFMVDNTEESYLYYMNCAVKVTKDNVETISYRNLKGHVWEKQKIDRDFIKSDFTDSEFKYFIKNISGERSDSTKSMESTLGYLMHSHKPASYCPAVILNDEIISDNPEGGTGKGIFVKSISHIKKMVIIDGKGFSFQKSFPYQRVQVDTQTLVFDDVAKNFDFERLFSVITEGITLEKKNKDEIHIPFEYSPKIVITTNYAIKGAGNSFERRKWDLEFKQYYTKSFTPESDFGHMLFSEWTDSEWSKFDNYMIDNLQLYLKRGLVVCEFKNLKVRNFIAETNSDFWEWADSNDNVYTDKGTSFLGMELFNNFIEEYPDYGPYGKFKVSHSKFYKWLDSYGKFKYDSKPIITRKSNGKMVEFIELEPEQVKLNF